MSASAIVAVVLEPLQHLLDDGKVERREREEEGGRQRRTASSGVRLPFRAGWSRMWI